MLLTCFFTPQKYQKTSGSLTFYAALESDHWHEMG